MVYALVDCNNFYVSCERAFNPKLENKPVVVLSNNDGNVISRSNEAKKLGIPMGAPFFKWQKLCAAHDVVVFSSNYELYADMSFRVMQSLAKFCGDMEIYSIDEAFLYFQTANRLIDHLIEMRIAIKRWTGIPISIGFSSTKTLAKVANYMAKHHTIQQVYDLCDQQLQNEVLVKFPIEKIWGIGSQLAARMNALGIQYAKQLRDADPKMLRLHSSVVTEKTVRELCGESCLTLEISEPRKQIVSSRSFGKVVTALDELEEAVSHYAAIASRKLRKQHSLAAGIYVFLHTNVFNAKAKQYSNGTFFPFPMSTDNTSYIIRIAKKCLRHIYREGFNYHKAGIVLMNLSSNKIKQHDMLAIDNTKAEQLIITIDKINNHLGKNTLFYCAEGIKRSWSLKSDYLSRRYTTRFSELPVVVI